MPVPRHFVVRRSLWALLWAVLAGFFLFAFYFRYWVYRHEFNDLGRYWDGVEVHTDSAFVWCLPAAAFGLALGVSVLRTWYRLRAMKRAG